MRHLTARIAVLLGLVLATLPAPATSLANAAKTSDVMILTMENGQPATDACYELVDFSNIGCDENRDGGVTFMDIPIGTYTLHQTPDLGPGRHVDDVTITVTGTSHSPWEFFTVYITTDEGIPANTGTADISLITRDPKTGTLLTGTCYELAGYSNTGCDENGDGQVTFADIPFGTYTVHQTQAPSGYPIIDDFEIFVQHNDFPLGYIVKQARTQNTPKTRNVSVVLVNTATNQKVVSSETCLQIVDASNIGCDNDLTDGQIDFLDVPAGHHELAFTTLPEGFIVDSGPDSLHLTIDPARSPTDVIIYVGLKPAP
ncbi:MAG TPA: SpaA isopeptide-forming pilin-related protein [Thermomicrobiales bacterium]|nr:SpaA isopeptide-forming pilin-related protein [Thermomicrobiales bacterium]